MSTRGMAAGLLTSLALVGACGTDDETGGGGSPAATGTATAPGGSGGGGSTASGTGTATTSGTGTATATGTAGGGGGAGATGGGGGGPAATACDEPNPDGAEIVDLVNAYRQANGKPAIPYSPSLSCVAVTHVRDLADNQPHAPSQCNLHSWSDQGTWSACCYTADHAEAQCMWDKPHELTSYTGNGYENAAAGVTTPQQAVSAWQGSPAHDDVMLNEGMWASHPWSAVGAGIHQGYATLWFGEQADPAH